MATQSTTAPEASAATTIAAAAAATVAVDGPLPRTTKVRASSSLMVHRSSPLAYFITHRKYFDTKLPELSERWGIANENDLVATGVWKKHYSETYANHRDSKKMISTVLEQLPHRRFVFDAPWPDDCQYSAVQKHRDYDDADFCLEDSDVTRRVIEDAYRMDMASNSGNETYFPSGQWLEASETQLLSVMILIKLFQQTEQETPPRESPFTMPQGLRDAPEWNTGLSKETSVKLTGWLRSLTLGQFVSAILGAPFVGLNSFPLGLKYLRAIHVKNVFECTYFAALIPAIISRHRDPLKDWQVTMWRSSLGNKDTTVYSVRLDAMDVLTDLWGVYSQAMRTLRLTRERFCVHQLFGQ